MPVKSAYYRLHIMVNLGGGPFAVRRARSAVEIE
jgi:hypothetical protein